jgi:hypothetical protein
LIFLLRMMMLPSSSLRSSFNMLRFLWFWKNFNLQKLLISRFINNERNRNMLKISIHQFNFLRMKAIKNSSCWFFGRK